MHAKQEYTNIFVLRIRELITLAENLPHGRILSGPTTVANMFRLL